MSCHWFTVTGKRKPWTTVKATDKRILGRRAFSCLLSRIQGFPGLPSTFQCHTTVTWLKTTYRRLDIWDSGLDRTHQIIPESAHISFTFGAGGDDDDRIWTHCHVCTYGWAVSHWKASVTSLLQGSTLRSSRGSLLLWVWCHADSVLTLQHVHMLLIPSAAAHRNKRNLKYMAAMCGMPK